MSVFAGLITGLLAVRLLREVTRDLLRGRALQRENYRGREVPVAAGMLVVATVLLIEAGRVIVGAVLEIGDVPSGSPARTLVLGTVLGFGLLGLWDDMVGDDRESGFRGHVRALISGRMTSGGLKMIGGGASAAVIAASTTGDSLRRLLVAAAVIALAANLGNLFDRAPGRVIKLGVIAYLPLAFVAGAGSVGAALAPVVGATVGLLGDDLRERLMLGDCGANLFGAALGVGAVLTLGQDALIVLMIGLVVLNALAEIVSFSRVIERVSFFRAIDHVGRDLHE